MSLTTARVQCKADDIRNKHFITYSMIIITRARVAAGGLVRISTNVASLPRTKDAQKKSSRLYVKETNCPIIRGKLSGTIDEANRKINNL